MGSFLVIPNQEAQASKYSSVAVWGNNCFNNSFILSLFSSKPTDIESTIPLTKEFLMLVSMCFELSSCPAFTDNIRALANLCCICCIVENSIAIKDLQKDYNIYYLTAIC